MGGNGELFYRSRDARQMFSVNPALTIGTPEQRFQGYYYIAPTGSPRPQYSSLLTGNVS